MVVVHGCGGGVSFSFSLMCVCVGFAPVFFFRTENMSTNEMEEKQLESRKVQANEVSSSSSSERDLIRRKGGGILGFNLVWRLIRF